MSDDSEPETISLPGLSSLVIPKLHRACASCEFGVKEQSDLVCRYNPPQVTFMAVPGMQMTPKGPQHGVQLQNFTGFPIVRPDQWCGRFTKRG